MRAPSTPVKSDLTLPLLAVCGAVSSVMWAGIIWFGSWLIPLLIQSV